MPRVTTDERRINYLCMEVGFQPEHVYEFTKMMLIEYKKGRDMLRFPISQKTVEEMYEEKLRLRHEFLEIMKKPFDEAKGLYKDFVLKVVNAYWFPEKINLVLEYIGDFRNIGEIYRDILETCYFSDTPLTNDEATKSVGIGDTALDYRKREAIKIFGLQMYSLCLRRENEDLVAGIITK